MEAIVAERNAALEQVYDEIDTLLAATLSVDDYVDLEKLRVAVEHPPFARTALEAPTPPVTPILDPPEPKYVEPAEPKGLFGKKRKHEEAVEAARAQHAADLAAWQAEIAELPARRKSAEDEYNEAEAGRLRLLEEERAKYAADCAVRESQAAEQNATLDTFIANLGYGDTNAIEEYVSIVLANSAYPEHFPVRHEFTFDPDSAELSLRCFVPGPDKIPTIKAYKYTKSSDEITETQLPQKAIKDRYMGAVEQVALRSIHEVFEADRRGLIRSVTLEVGADTTDPATGKDTYVPFVAVAADREAFTEFDLAAVVPSATLSHLGAAVTKNAVGLVPADLAGIRRL
jgi:restriction system protein